ncbi:unnamed protein product [Callosobruchus maculatus]|uniref:THAP-type domain-containing protein n=1 Tax=Callosobruchus maculatus TaxID=64391 RepID=A0A653CBV0_CALMS|nr:unnamed protein product [Callosobruchus maculatus]
MPRRCYIPGCKSNYDSSLKDSNNNNKCETTFSFPKCPQRLARWLNAIPRKEWTPSKSSVVCAKHFSESDVIRFHEFKTPSGEIKKVSLAYPKLCESATPRKFPNLPNYLSSDPPRTRADPEKRRENFLQCGKKVLEDFLSEDVINNFEDLLKNFKNKIPLHNWDIKACSDKLLFYGLNFDIHNGCSVIRTLMIASDLTVRVYIKNNELYEKQLNWILNLDHKLERWSQLENLISHYNTVEDFEVEVTVVDMISRGLAVISKAYTQSETNDGFLYGTQLEIIIDQLTQIVSNKRRYKPSTIIMAFILYCQSPSCYDIVRDFFILPHKRYLQSISGSLAVSPKDEHHNKNYFASIIKTLSVRELVVTLIIDEICVTSRLDYRAQTVVGYAENDSSNKDEFAKTIVAFMVCSAFGNLNEIVKLWPVNNVKGNELASMTKEVINFVQECGCEVVPVVTDNHRINRTMFKTISGNGQTFPNPKDTKKNIFLLYDLYIFLKIYGKTG